MYVSESADAKLLDGMIDPQPFADWMSDRDLQVYVEAFRAGGFRGPLNRYRANHNVADGSKAPF
jgi:hypothetical protein